MRRLVSLIAIGLLATSCTAEVGDDPTTTAEATTTTSPTVAPVDVTTTETSSQSPCLDGDRPFAAAGLISAFGGATGDASQVSSIRVGTHPGCERVVIDLLTADGAPAGSLGPVAVEYRADSGVIRVNLPDSVLRTAIADSTFDGELAERAYVVRTAAGHLAVDVHVAVGVAVSLRAYEVGAPSRIVVDLRPDDAVEPVRGAVRDGAVVVVTPTDGPVPTTLEVSGYSRGTGDITAELYTDSEEAALVAATVAANDWSQGWGEFVIELTAPSSDPLLLVVGNGSAEAQIGVNPGTAIDLGNEDT